MGSHHGTVVLNSCLKKEEERGPQAARSKAGSSGHRAWPGSAPKPGQVTAPLRTSVSQTGERGGSSPHRVGLREGRMGACGSENSTWTVREAQGTDALKPRPAANPRPQPRPRGGPYLVQPVQVQLLPHCDVTECQDLREPQGAHRDRVSSPGLRREEAPWQVAAHPSLMWQDVPGLQISRPPGWLAALATKTGRVRGHGALSHVNRCLGWGRPQAWAVD